MHARRIQLHNGVPVVTDGPYAETQEVLAGYWIVECDSFDRATELAAELSKCPGPAYASASVIDVRPIADRATSWTPSQPSDAEPQDLLRLLAPQVFGVLVRRYGHFDTAEDATQEALIAAATTWPKEGHPDNPLGWLIIVGSRRLTDLLRSEQARERRQARSTSSGRPPSGWRPRRSARGGH